jgi:DNA-binding PadR family transcriptional regulator
MKTVIDLAANSKDNKPLSFFQFAVLTILKRGPGKQMTARAITLETIGVLKRPVESCQTYMALKRLEESKLIDGEDDHPRTYKISLAGEERLQRSIEDYCRVMGIEKAVKL